MPTTERAASSVDTAGWRHLEDLLPDIERWSPAQLTAEEVSLGSGLTRIVAQRVTASSEELPSGVTLLQPGDRLSAHDITMAATWGVTQLRVWRRLRVAVLAVDDETTPAQAHDLNTDLTAALFRRIGCKVAIRRIARDRVASAHDTLVEAAAAHELVIASDWRSCGTADPVITAVRSLGTFACWKVSSEPGDPLALGTLGSSVFIGLPKEPLVGLLALLMVARPIALRLAGARSITPERVQVATATTVQRHPLYRQFLPGKLEADGGRPTVRRYQSDGAEVLSSLIWADGFIDVPVGAGTIRQGQIVDFIPLTEVLG